MGLVQPDWISRRLAQVLGTRTVLHDAIMHVRTARVVGRPPDDGQVVRGQLDLWRFGDPDALGLLDRRKYLSGAGLVGDEAGDGGRNRQPRKQRVHGCSRPYCFAVTAPRRAAVPPGGFRGHAGAKLPSMGGNGTGGTPQMAGEQGGSGGVGMRSSFPWVEAEPPDMHWPVKVSMLG